MKSIYESIRDVMEMGSRGHTAAPKSKDEGPLMKRVFPSLYDKDRNSKPQASSTPAATSKPYTDSSGTEYDAAGNPAKAAKSQANIIPANKSKPYKDSAGTEYDDAGNPAKLAPKPQASKLAPSKPKTYTNNDTSSYSGRDVKDNTNNTTSSYSGRDVKNEPKADAPAAGKRPGGIAFNQDAPASSEKPQATTTKPDNVDDAATKARDSLKGTTPASTTVDTKDTEQFRTKTYTKPEKQEPDTTVRDSSGNAIKTGSGGTLRTDTPDEIANRGPFGIPKKKTNEHFNVSDDLYNSVMEVLQKGSKPRHEKEKKLAAMHGDPDVITHGDILKARGVKMKEETEQVDEGDFSKWHSDTIDGHKVTAHHNYNSGTDSTYTGKVNGKKWKHNFDNSAAHHGMKEGDWVHKNNPHLSKDEAHAVAKYQDKHWELHEQIQVNEMSSKQKMKLGLYNKKKPVKENRDTPGNSYEHQCAIHVKSESFGEGRTVTTQHAEPDAYGNIAWYDVMFEHGIEKYVPTAELEILVSESHMHSMKKKKKM
jgi:hypothetical protein